MHGAEGAYVRSSSSDSSSDEPEKSRDRSGVEIFLPFHSLDLFNFEQSFKIMPFKVKMAASIPMSAGADHGG
jgi:hypothetical protein